MTDAAPTEIPYDIEFFWDPVCPFAWITSRWIEKVAEQTSYAVDWRFISLRLLNKRKDYATEFPAGYEHGHTAGLRMLRVAAAVRADLGREPLGAARHRLRRELLGQAARVRDARAPEHHRPRHRGAHGRRPVAVVRRRARRHVVGRRARCRDRARGGCRGRARRRHAHHHVQPPQGVSFFGPVISGSLTTTRSSRCGRP